MAKKPDPLNGIGSVFYDGTAEGRALLAEKFAQQTIKPIIIGDTITFRGEQLVTGVWLTLGDDGEWRVSRRAYARPVSMEAPEPEAEPAVENEADIPLTPHLAEPKA
jgi:hypothetical protein